MAIRKEDYKDLFEMLKRMGELKKSMASSDEENIFLADLDEPETKAANHPIRPMPEQREAARENCKPSVKFPTEKREQQNE